MIGLRGTITAGAIGWIGTAAICGIADQIRHIHHATVSVWNTPVEVGVAAAALYFTSPLVFTVLGILISGRVSNALISLYSNPALVALALAITQIAVAPWKPSLRVMPTSASLPVWISVLLISTATLFAIARSKERESRSLYGIFFPRFRGPRPVRPATTTVQRTPITPSDRVSATFNKNWTPAPSRAKDTDWDNGGGGYDDTRDRNNDALTLKAENDAAYHANQARITAQNKEFSDRTYTEHQAKNAAKQQASVDHHARQAELNRQHDVDAANRAAADRAAAQRHHDEAAARRAADERAAQERQRHQDDLDRQRRQQQDDADRRRRNGGY